MDDGDVARSGVDGDNDDLDVVSRLFSIAKSIRQLAAIKLAKIDVVVGQDQFVLCLADGVSRPLSEIAELLAIRPSTVSKMSDRLEEKGWIARTPDPSDARRVFLHLTRAGVMKTLEVRRIEIALGRDLAKALASEPQALSVLANVDAALILRVRRLR